MFATGVSNKQFTRTTGKTPAKVAVQTSTDDFSKLMIYKRLYKKDKAQTFGKLYPALTADAIAQRMGKKKAKADNKNLLTVNGCMVANSTWGNNTQYGMYSFTAPEYTSTLLKQEEELLPNGGGVLVGDTYYLTYFYSYYGYNFVYFERYNAETWEFLGDTSTSMQDVATDLTYDPITENVYGFFVSDNGKTMYGEHLTLIPASEHNLQTPITR